MTIELSKMSVVDLKAFAYDQLALQEVCLANLRAANQEIQRKVEAENSVRAQLEATEKPQEL